MADRLVYTVAETAELLGIALGTAYECVRNGDIPSIKLGRRIAVPRKALQQLLDEAQQNAHSTNVMRPGR